MQRHRRISTGSTSDERGCAVCGGVCAVCSAVDSVGVGTEEKRKKAETKYECVLSCVQTRATERTPVRSSQESRVLHCAHKQTPEG